MGNMKYCDLCGKPSRKGNIARDYQVSAKLELFDIHDEGDGEEALEFERMDLCAACVHALAERVKIFIVRIKSEAESQQAKVEAPGHEH